MKTASQQLRFPRMLSINYFCNPWLCFNYVSACFESSAHWGAALFQDEEIEMNFPTRFTFLGISSEFHNHVVHDLRFPPLSSQNNKKHLPWIILRLMSAGPFIFTPRSPRFHWHCAVSRSERCLCFKRGCSAERGMQEEKIFKTQSEKSQRCISQATATLSN